METLNRYIDGGRKRNQTTDLAWYRGKWGQSSLFAHLGGLS